MKKFISALIVTFAFAQLAFAATVDTGYIAKGVDTMTGIEMLNGRMMTTWTVGQPLAMINSVTMSNGTTVMPDGFITMASGATSWMKNGESMNLNGQITSVGSGNVPAPAQTAPSAVYGMRTVTTTLNVRSWAGIGDNLIGHLNTGATVDVLGKSSTGYWCRISYKNYRNAWVACRYLAQ